MEPEPSWHSAPLLINTASGHGLMRWIATSDGWSALQRVLDQGVSSEQSTSSKDLVLLSLAAWFLKCLGVDDDIDAFRSGWQSSDPDQKESHSTFNLGYLCRHGPQIMRSQTAVGESSQQAAMFDCYRNLLMHPELERTNDVDDYVDERLKDVQLSQAVYQYNFKVIIRDCLAYLLSDCKILDPLVLIDVGAGNGNVLLDIAQVLQSFGCECICVAVDPSATSRAACIDMFSEHKQLQLYTLNGDVEAPARLADTLHSQQINTSKVVIIAKSSLHDRSIVCSGSANQGNDGLDGCLLESHVSGYVYRDSSWNMIKTEEVSRHLTGLLNLWRTVFEDSFLFVMESHVIPPVLMNRYLLTVPILPAYLSHSLSGQYLLPYSQHVNALEKSDYTMIKKFPLHDLQGWPLMSLILAQS